MNGNMLCEKEAAIEKERGIILVLAKAENYTKAVLKLIEYAVNIKKEPGVYVTLNKPYVAMKKLLENKVDLRMLIFIDAFTQLAGGKPEKSEGVLFLNNAEDLTGLSIALDQAVKSIPTKQKFVFLDSLSTLLIYNKSGSVTKFIHFLTCKMRLWEIDGIFISLDEEDDQVISKLKMFCDKIMHIDEKLAN
ncbi:MAG: ATPase domain-containing protein [Methanocellales archaeon]